MKKSIKLISLLLISIAMILVGKENVFAESNVPKTFTAKSKSISTKPVGLEKYNISVKYTSDGTYIYCYEVYKNVPNNVLYTVKSTTSDYAINYIIGSGRSDNSENDFFATQAALWIYLYDSGYMKDTNNNYIATIKSNIEKYPNEPIYQNISNILSAAKNKDSSYFEAVQITSNSASFDLNGGVYVSDLIKVNKNSSSYDIELVDAPNGAYTKKETNGFRIYVPEDSLSSLETNISVKVTNEVYRTYRYSASNSQYQDMLIAYPEEYSDTINLTIEKEVTVTPIIPVEKDVTKIVISKQDITNKGVELPGATLVIKNSKGEVVEKWVSTDKAHEFDSLEVGTYTLTETIAPEGYELSSETISFTVEKDGKIVTKVMYNTPKKEEEKVTNKVVISKKDITTKEELEGATLVVKNNKGEELYKWVSGKEAYVIEHLDEGTYTLTEIQAPNGYILNEEVLTFEVINNKPVTEVVMFNTPLTSEIIDVPATGALASSLPYLIGGLVIIMGSVLLYKNAKKEQ